MKDIKAVDKKHTFYLTGDLVLWLKSLAGEMRVPEKTVKILTYAAVSYLDEIFECAAKILSAHEGCSTLKVADFLLSVEIEREKADACAKLVKAFEESQSGKEDRSQEEAPDVGPEAISQVRELQNLKRGRRETTDASFHLLEDAFLPKRKKLCTMVSTPVRQSFFAKSRCQSSLDTSESRSGRREPSPPRDSPASSPLDT